LRDQELTFDCFLRRCQVLPGVPALVPEVQIESTFPDGTKLLTIHGPIAAEVHAVNSHMRVDSSHRLTGIRASHVCYVCNVQDGDLEEALRGSFLPTPEVLSPLRAHCKCVQLCLACALWAMQP